MNEREVIARVVWGADVGAGTADEVVSCGVPNWQLCLSEADAILAALDKAGKVVVPQEPTTMWRHIKRGSVYREICRAEVQAATGPICEGDMVVIYGDALGHVWARKVSEFEDGRFERVAALKETGHE
jgi:hypothetical protein